MPRDRCCAARPIAARTSSGSDCERRTHCGISVPFRLGPECNRRSFVVPGFGIALASRRPAPPRHPGEEMSIRRASIVTGSIVTVALAWSIASAFAATRVVYVDAHAKSGGTGRSWNDAYRSLDDALRAARTGDQVWVADGTY